MQTQTKRRISKRFVKVSSLNGLLKLQLLYNNRIMFPYYDSNACAKWHRFYVQCISIAGHSRTLQYTISEESALRKRTPHSPSTVDCLAVEFLASAFSYRSQAFIDELNTCSPNKLFRMKIGA